MTTHSSHAMNFQGDSDDNVKETRSINPAEPSNPLTRFLGLLPGIALLAAVGYGGKLIEAALKTYGKTHQIKAMPNIEYVLWAILIGALIGNALSGKRWFKTIFASGIATYEFWLKIGIVFMGARFLLRDIAKLGGLTLGLVAIELVISILLMIVIGKMFGLSEKLTALLAIGSSICGVSAIIAAQGAIDSDEKETSYAIAAILALGAISLFTYPAIAHGLHMSEQAYGVWAGLSVDNTAEATAAGALYSPHASEIAVLTKTTRNAMIGFVVLGAALYFAARTGRKFEGSKALFVWRVFPKFVLGFLLFSAIASIQMHDAHGNVTFQVFNAAQMTSLANLSKWAFLLTFAGVGLRTNVQELFQQGIRPFIVGAVGELFIAGVTLLLVIGADRMIGLK